MDNTNNNNNVYDSRRHNYASPQQQQQAMYGYPPPPQPARAAAGYPPQQPQVMIPPSSSGPGQMYNMQQQYPYPTSGQSRPPPQMNGYMPGPGQMMGQVMQQHPQYAMPQSHYPQQAPSYQSQQGAPPSLSQMLNQQQQSQHFMQPQPQSHPPLQAYQIDGAPGHPSSPAMNQPQRNQNRHGSASQPRPHPAPNHMYETLGSPVRNVHPVPNTPSRPQAQQAPQSQVQQRSQPQAQQIPQPQVQIDARTPSRPHPQSQPTPQVQVGARTPSQSQVPPKRPSQPNPQPTPQQRPSQSNSQPTSQQRPTPQAKTPQVVIEVKQQPSSQSRSTPVTTQARKPSSDELPVDYQLLLLGLADEYISKAHGMSASMTRKPQQADVDQYYKLISAGLSCMESVLKNWKFPDPSVEARLQLRYANLLLEETDNDRELQELLIKGVALCERNRLGDLKYSMKHLQARSTFRSNPRTAFKMVDQMIEVTETYSHFSWMYSFRFLRVSFSLELPKPDLSAALQQLHRITQFAEKQRQTPILATSAAIEALVHLRSGNTDSLELFQRSLAAARTHQLHPVVAGISQIKALLDCLDLCCDLINVKPDQLHGKMRVMQVAMDEGQRSASWGTDGTFLVPLNETAPPNLSADTCGVMEKSPQGNRALAFTWIKRSEMFALGYIFSTLASMKSNVVDGKAEKYGIEGSKVTQDDFNPNDESKIQSLRSASAQHERRSFYHRLTLLLLVFAKCDRSDWQGAKEALASLSEDTTTTNVEENDFLQTTLLYLTGVVKQALGDLEGALELYKLPALTLVAGSKVNSPLRDLQLLSTLNTILIIRPREHCRREVARLLEMIEHICLYHPNTSFQSALNIVRASSTAGLSILRMKNFLSLSANTAKKQSNQQLLCITINLMTSTFFVDIMGEKAEMSARVGKTLAERTRSPLWKAVANQMLGNTLEFGGQRPEAELRKREAVSDVQKVPEGVKQRFVMQM